VQLSKAEAASAPKTVRSTPAEVPRPSVPPPPPLSRPSDLQLPLSCVMQRTVNGVSYEVRRLIIVVREGAVDAAIKRDLLDRDDRDKPWTVTTALFANLFADHVIEWLKRRGWQGDRSSAESIISAVNDTFAQLPR
jgi:hypothetical protein